MTVIFSTCLYPSGSIYIYPKANYYSLISQKGARIDTCRYVRGTVAILDALITRNSYPRSSVSTFLHLRSFIASVEITKIPNFSFDFSTTFSSSAQSHPKKIIAFIHRYILFTFSDFNWCYFAVLICLCVIDFVTVLRKLKDFFDSEWLGLKNGRWK